MPHSKSGRCHTGVCLGLFCFAVIYLLCSDGLCGVCRDEEIIETMNKYHDDIEECKKELINAALNAGGYDNVTVALLEVVDDDCATVVNDTCEIKAKKRKSKKMPIMTIIIILMAIALVVLFLTRPECFGNIQDSITDLFHKDSTNLN